SQVVNQGVPSRQSFVGLFDRRAGELTFNTRFGEQSFKFQENKDFPPAAAIVARFPPRGLRRHPIDGLAGATSSASRSLAAGRRQFAVIVRTNSCGFVYAPHHWTTSGIA